MTGRVWIVGASYGIGAALARHLADQGQEVWASARSADKLEAMAAESGGRIRALPLDVTDKASVQAAHDAIDAAGGPPDIVVLNAGSHQPVAAKDFKADELRRLIELNVMGVANGIEVVLPGMIARDRGRLAVVASVAGYSGLPTSAYYGCTKGGVINMVEIAGLRSAQDGRHAAADQSGLRPDAAHRQEHVRDAVSHLGGAGGRAYRQGPRERPLRDCLSKGLRLDPQGAADAALPNLFRAGRAGYE